MQFSTFNIIISLILFTQDTIAVLVVVCCVCCLNRQETDEIDKQNPSKIDLANIVNESKTYQLGTDTKSKSRCIHRTGCGGNHMRMGLVLLITT